jgi:AcrR family transcriptional regulator
MSGRRGEAIRNDARILEAARDVFVDDPDAPVSAVAALAGVGIGALYRRYPSKEDLLRQLARNGLRRYVIEAEAAVADLGDPWEAFAAFMRRIVDTEVHSITISLAGTFTPTDDLLADATRAAALNEEILRRTKAHGGLRADIVVSDLSLIFEQLAAIRLGEKPRKRALQQRYLALFLDGLRAKDAQELPGRPPSANELSRRWWPAVRT